MGQNFKRRYLNSNTDIILIMARGFCSSCGKEIGTFLKPAGFQCRNCMNIFCFDCSKKIGLIFKRPVCPTCGIELVDDVRKEQLREERHQARAVGLGMEEGRRRAIEETQQKARMEMERKKMFQSFGSIFSPPPEYRKNKKKR